MYVAQGQIAAADSVYSVLLCVSEPIAERIALGLSRLVPQWIGISIA